MGIEDVILEATKEEGRQEGRVEGRQEGRIDEKVQTALRMKKAGFSIADIVKATGLTKKQVEQL